MKFGYQHTPAGNPVLPHRHYNPEAWLARRFSGQPYVLFESGTAALSAAVRSILARDQGAHRNRVIIPAYGCPSLPAAVLAAGGEPILVDFEPDRPWLNLSDLKNTINDRTAAIVAVDLFGISERYRELRQIIKGSGIVLLQDAAQRPPPDFSREQTGDIVVLSFGRGKPASILTGGAVIICNNSLHVRAGDWPEAGKPRYWLIKSGIYNALLSPYLYWLPAAIPWLGLGQTVFHPLHHVRRLNRQLLPYLPSNIEASDRFKGEVAQMLQTAFNQSLGDWIVDLPSSCGANLANLNRYPVLARSAELRENLLATLGSIGATSMYRKPLPEIAGMPPLLRHGESFPNAKHFSETLLTLPVHSRIGRRDIRKLAAILKKRIDARDSEHPKEAIPGRRDHT